MKKMLIIKDLKGWFWATFPDWETAVSLSVDYISHYFVSRGFNVEITCYKDFNFQNNYKDYFVLYGSAEDYCGGSKAFIEDIIVHLMEQGAILLPEFKYFRAHDNKVMMEILRHTFNDNQLKTIRSKVWPSLEIFKQKINDFDYPVILKRSTGAGGEGVFLAHNTEELLYYAEKVSRLIDLNKFYIVKLKNNIKENILRRPIVPIHNTKFITQNFIKNLYGDYKVLVFGDHYFVLHRINRKNDFRASGSGVFTEDNGPMVEKVLDLALLCKSEIDAPHLSLDIAFDGEECHLIEFQCLTFGFKAMSMSKMHYIRNCEKWEEVNGKVIPEEEYCYAVEQYLKSKEVW